MEEKNVGSSFDSWLREEGIYEEVTAAAMERSRARQAADRKSTGLRKTDTPLSFDRRLVGLRPVLI